VIRALVAIACLSCLGCTQGYTHFDHPIVDDRGVSVDPALIGRWSIELDDQAPGTADADEDGEKMANVTVSADGEVLIVSPASEPGGAPQVDHTRLVTARIGNDTIASVRSGPDDDDGWAYFRYWIAAPGVVSFTSDDTRFWKDAVRNKMVSGTIETTASGEGITVTATGPELRAFVHGYGRVIFRDEEMGRLRRAPGGS
jgi:hypothetical protein